MSLHTVGYTMQVYCMEHHDVHSNK